MALLRHKFYLTLIAAGTAGYVWLFISFSGHTSLLSGCLIKHVTHVPCPSCGSTRSVLAILQGDFIAAIERFNPLGYLMVAALLVLPLWIFADVFRGKNSLIAFSHRLERNLRRPPIAIFLTLLLLVNWIWNISKGL